MADDADIVRRLLRRHRAHLATAPWSAARAKGLKVGLVRPITLWPFPVDEIAEAVGTAKAYLSVEMNMGQMVDDVRLAVNGRRSRGVLRTAPAASSPPPTEVLAKLEAMASELGISCNGCTKAGD